MTFIRWSDSAKECYKIKCDCKNCKIVPDWFKEKCQMYKSVEQLLLLYGEPKNKS